MNCKFSISLSNLLGSFLFASLLKLSKFLTSDVDIRKMIRKLQTIFLLFIAIALLVILCVHELSSSWRADNCRGPWIAEEESSERQLNILVDNDAPKSFSLSRKEFTGDGVITVVLVVCGGTLGENMKSSARQIKQATTLIKSAVYLSSRPLRFILASDSRDNFDSVVASVSKLPANLKSKFLLEFRPSKYPPHSSHMKEMFRPCASQKLFVDVLLPDEDAVIYVDTDVIFVRPPEALWDEFGRFDSSQLMAAAMPTNTMWRTGKNENKFKYKNQGLNAGVVLFNLTRLRDLPGGLTDTVLAMFEEPLQPRNDQEVINYFAIQRPELFYELDCAWNFRMGLCSELEKCPGAQTHGAYAVHGVSGSFQNGVPMLKGLFEVWSNFNVSRPLADLIGALEQTLSRPTKHACSSANGVDKIILRQLYEYLRLETSRQ